MPGTPSLRASCWMDKNLKAPAHARAWLRAVLGSARVEQAMPSVADFTESSELLLSELVTNGVTHAETAVEIRCSMQRSDGLIDLFVEVSDFAPQRRINRSEMIDDQLTHGRGMGIIELVATDWGIRYTATAKTVWFLLREEMPLDRPTVSTGGASSVETDCYVNSL
ncbi:ATP-binding protein [Bacillus subtilis]